MTGSAFHAQAISNVTLSSVFFTITIADVSATKINMYFLLGSLRLRLNLHLEFSLRGSQGLTNRRTCPCEVQR